MYRKALQEKSILQIDKTQGTVYDEDRNDGGEAGWEQQLF